MMIINSSINGGGGDDEPSFDDYSETLSDNFGSFVDPSLEENQQLNLTSTLTMKDIFHQRLQSSSSMIIITNEVNEAAVIIAYSLIVIISLIGNSLVVKIAFSGRRIPGRSQRARTTTDVLIGSLSFSDLVMTIFNIPFNLARLLLPYWPFGRALCYGVPFVQTACVYVSTFTMAAIALHRWRMVSHPTTAMVNKSNRAMTSPLRSSNSLRRTIAIVWLISFGLAAPTVAFNTLKMANVNGRVVIRCRVDYPMIYGINASLLLTIEIFLTQYLIPLVITGVLYLKIASVIHRQSRFTKLTTNMIINNKNNNNSEVNTHNNEVNNCQIVTESPGASNYPPSSSVSPHPSIIHQSSIFGRQQQTYSSTTTTETFMLMMNQGGRGKRRRQLEVKRRRILMLSLVVAVFAICWLPLNLYHLTIDLGLGQHRLTVFLACHWFAMSSVCYNSFIYCWLNESFRQNAIDLLRSLMFACVKFHHHIYFHGRKDDNNNHRDQNNNDNDSYQQEQQQHHQSTGKLFSDQNNVENRKLTAKQQQQQQQLQLHQTDDQQRSKTHGVLFSSSDTTLTSSSGSNGQMLNSEFMINKKKKSKSQSVPLTTTIIINDDEQQQQQQKRSKKYLNYFESVEEEDFVEKDSEEEVEEDNHSKISHIDTIIELGEQKDDSQQHQQKPGKLRSSLSTKLPFRSSSSSMLDKNLKVPRIEVTDLSGVMIGSDDHSRCSAIFNDCEDDDDDEDEDDEVILKEDSKKH